jgi:hypothetical protein
MKNPKTKVLFLKAEDTTGIIEGNVMAYFPSKHRTTVKIKGKIITMEENPGQHHKESIPAEKSQYRNLLLDLIVSGRKNLQVLNKK